MATIVIVGDLSRLSKIRELLERRGHTVIQIDDPDEAFSALSSAEESTIGDLYIIGSDLDPNGKNNLLPWLSEETSIPFLGLADAASNSKYRPYEYIDQTQTEGQIVSRIIRYLENVRGS
jgi:hypothetical protein